MDRLQPLILGSGSAGRALRTALAMYPEEIAPPQGLARDAPLPDPDPERSLLVVANPHALHAPRLLEAAELGYRWAICEKPVAVDLEQVELLEGLPLEVWVCHGYRLLWGPETIRQARIDGRFGELLAVEGRYWQSSATRGPRTPGWKDDPALGGHHDVLLDLATHWVDLMIFLTGEAPMRTRIRRWWVNAASEHRDTHVHVTMEHGGATSLGSVSKTVHGAGNHLQFHVLGADASASWSFADPDVVVWGQGADRRVEARTKADPPARLAPFHGLGWTEGYASLVGDLVGHVVHGQPRRGPGVRDQIVVLRALLEAVETA